MGFRYIGGKTRLLSEISSKISDIVPRGSQITDLMCGTASVSAFLRKEGFCVTANDIMTYSYHHARIMLLFTNPPTFTNANEFINHFYPKTNDELFPLTPYECILKALNQVPLERGYFWKEFSLEGTPKNYNNPRNYFTPYNARKIDAIRSWIHKLHISKQINDLEHSLLIHDLIMAVNDIANIAGTYGHYLSRAISRAKDPIILKPTPIIILNDKGKHKIFQEYAEDLAKKISCDLCYIDPPYMKRQYAANYHILETLARGDNPKAIGVSGLRPWRDQYSNFCTKTRIRDSFRQIFSEMKCEHFLISYSEDGLLTPTDIEKLFTEFGIVKTFSFKYKRFKSNSSKLNPYLNEYIFHLKIN